jgi:hypothetical protein
MTDSRQTQSSAAPDARKKATTPLNRAEIEQSLNKVLAAGPIAIEQQVRYLLAYSQKMAAQSVTTPYPEKPLTVAQARVAALTEIADVLNDAQIKTLLRDARQIADLEVRLQMLTRLALRNAPQQYRTVIREMWNQVRTLKDPVVRARLIFRLAPHLTLMDDEPSASVNLLQVVSLAQSIDNGEARVRSLIALAPYLPQIVAARVLNRALDEIDQMTNDATQRNAIASLSDPLPDEIQARALRSAQAIESPGERARALTALAPRLPIELQPRLRADALEAINTIRSEEDRSEALIAFAPHLEYASGQDHFPALLERALGIAIAMSRRHLRAKALVALAPHLTLDLQGEALAAVHNLSNERERAALLANLAPNLPPEMLVASLAVAHTMREQDARAHALTILAHHVPERAQGQTLLDALAAAVNLPHHYERVRALVDLLDVLPQQLREQAYTNALETTRLIENENARARALSLLGQHLPPTLLQRALDAAYELEDAQQRLNALSGLVPHLVDNMRDDALKHLLECAQVMPFEYKKTRALVSIAPLLTPDLLKAALETAETLQDPYDRVSAYIALAQNLAPDQRPTLLTKAWELMKNIDDGYDRSSALAAIAPFLPPSAHPALAKEAAMVIGGIMDEYDQASAISILAGLLAEGEIRPSAPAPDYYLAIKEGLETTLQVSQQGVRKELLQEGVVLWAELHDPDQSYQLWREMIHKLKFLPLADVLVCLGTLTPVIRALAGDEGLQSIAQILGVR